MAGTGLVVNIRGKAKPSGDDFKIGLRADIDALPMFEGNKHLEYRSKTKAAHMCGHDGHTTCLLGGISMILQELENIPSNKEIRAIFQPAEEIGKGAQKMIEEGCLEGLDEIYGMHNYPQSKANQIHCIPGPVMAEI